MAIAIKVEVEIPEAFQKKPDRKIPESHIRFGDLVPDDQIEDVVVKRFFWRALVDCGFDMQVGKIALFFLYEHRPALARTLAERYACLVKSRGTKKRVYLQKRHIYWSQLRGKRKE